MCVCVEACVYVCVFVHSVLNSAGYLRIATVAIEMAVGVCMCVILLPSLRLLSASKNVSSVSLV